MALRKAGLERENREPQFTGMDALEMTLKSLGLVADVLVCLGLGTRDLVRLLGSTP